MYRQIVHFLQGQVLVRIECGCPERMLNLCGARGIPFWELTWESPVCLTLRAVGRDLPRLRQAAEDAGGSLHLCRSGGVPVFWRRLRRRYVLLAGAVLALVLMFGGNLVIYRSALSGVDESLYEAAKVDGAGPVRIFFSITLPEIKLPLFYTTIMTTTGAFNVWGQPVMLTNGGPNYQTQVLLMDIRNLAFPAGPAAAGMASAMALLLGIILMAIAAIQLIFMNKED